MAVAGKVRRLVGLRAYLESAAVAVERLDLAQSAQAQHQWLAGFLAAELTRLRWVGRVGKALPGQAGLPNTAAQAVVEQEQELQGRMDLEEVHCLVRAVVAEVGLSLRERPLLLALPAGPATHTQPAAAQRVARQQERPAALAQTLERPQCVAWAVAVAGLILAQAQEARVATVDSQAAVVAGLVRVRLA